MLQIALKLEAQTDLSSAAGYYNHLAMIHEGCDQLDDALKDISNGIEVDGDHFPLYETQAYVSWIKTHGGLASLGMAEKGLELAKGLPAKVQNDYASMQQNYDAVIRSQPGLAGVASARRKEIEDQYPAIFDQIKKYSDYFVANFKLDVAYFSALEQTNEAEARQFASDLTVANISDVDYRDCRGLVTMMFSNDNLDDLGHAQSDFKFAVENARILPDFINGKPSNDLILLCFHYQECQRRVAALNSP